LLAGAQQKLIYRGQRRACARERDQLFPVTLLADGASVPLYTRIRCADKEPLKREASMAEDVKLDEALRKILETARDQSRTQVVHPAINPSHAAVWPWQVPQAPTYTSNNGAPST
jgi:hypothetical protein